MSSNDLILAPSILAGNHANLAQSAREVEETGLEWIHLDIMDGHFVPNLTFGPQTVQDLRKDSELYFDTHLMLDNPDAFIHEFANAGANCITVHTEPEYNVHSTLKHIREYRCDCGIAINPDTSEQDLVPYLEEVDLVLLMTVQPGFGGQSFRDDVLPKIVQVAQWREEKGLNYRIQVDGGINLENASECLRAGVDTLVAGTSFFGADDKKQFAKMVLGKC